MRNSDFYRCVMSTMSRVLPPIVVVVCGADGRRRRRRAVLNSGGRQNLLLLLMLLWWYFLKSSSVGSWLQQRRKTENQGNGTWICFPCRIVKFWNFVLLLLESLKHKRAPFLIFLNARFKRVLIWVRELGHTRIFPLTLWFQKVTCFICIVRYF